jgi:HlyD family secretion protein
VVYVVRESKAHRVAVRVGTDDGKNVEVLSGLKPTDLVVRQPRGLTGDAVPVNVEEGPGDQ